MNLLLSFFKALVYSNIYLAATAAGLYWGIARFLNTEFRPELALVSFSFPLLYYNLCQFIGLRGKEKKDMTSLQLWVAENMTELIFGLFFVFLISVFFIFQLKLYLHILPMLLLVILGFVYLYFNRYIQQNALLKPILISISWCTLPLFIFGIEKMTEQPTLLIMLGLFIFNLCIIYDNKEEDSHSLMNKLGRTYNLLLTVFLHALIFLIGRTLSTPLNIYLLIGGLGISLIVLTFGAKIKDEWWHLVMTDGLIFVFALLLGLN